MRRLKRMPLTAVQPEGWYRRQLEIQRNGLSGKLHDLWDYVGPHCAWLGGTGDGWEDMPYYMDGLLPLSFYLKDEEHMELCRRFAEWTLGSQKEDGNFGPEVTWNDPWPHFVALKVLIQFEEITGDRRVLPFVTKYLEFLGKYLDDHEFRDWTRARVPDLLYSAKWVYEKTGDEKIPELMRRFDAAGIDWCDIFSDFPFPRKTAFYIKWNNLNKLNGGLFDDFAPYHLTHIVNNTMALKAPAMRAYFDGSRDYEAVSAKGMKEIIRRHGVPSGCINGDEHLAGNDPVQGAELCSVVEYMFSLQSLLEVFGSPVYGDLLERLAYNALPSTISEDFMAHQYLQQANQVQADVQKRLWFNNNSDASTYGFAPHFVCCLANMHQGWPKLADSLWFMESSDPSGMPGEKDVRDDVIVSTVFAPNTLTAQIAGAATAIQLDTDYPFRDTLTYRFGTTPGKDFTLKVRVPSWCGDPEFVLNGAAAGGEIRDGYFTLKRAFAPGDELRVRFPMQVTASAWFHGAAAVERGPLVYGLRMRERWETLRDRNGVKDYAVFAQSPWNYALELPCEIPEQQLPDRNCGSGDKNAAGLDDTAEIREYSVPGTPFSGESPAVVLRLPARRLEGWEMRNGNTSDLPWSPVERPAGDVTAVELVPFGCTKLRISEFPYYVNAVR